MITYKGSEARGNYKKSYMENLKLKKERTKRKKKT